MTNNAKSGKFDLSVPCEYECYKELAEKHIGGLVTITAHRFADPERDSLLYVEWTEPASSQED